MEHSFKQNIADKEERYKRFLLDWQLFVSAETDETAILANTSAALKEAFDFFWVGFYMVRNGVLVLGPFQGKVACVEIEVGKGVCGTAVKEDAVQLVPDVHAFPGHIACDGASRSEIVLPIHKYGKIVGVLDIDSPLPGRFTEDDKEGLSTIIPIIENLI